MEAALRRFVWQRADAICEYCQMSQAFDPLGFEIDHIIPEKHNGPTEAENLALACFACNHHKGPNLAGFDPKSGALTQLFNPRQDHWQAHFRWDSSRLVGLTPVGRTTIEVLAVNLPLRAAHRAALLTEGVFPPPSAAPTALN